MSIYNRSRKSDDRSPKTLTSQWWNTGVAAPAPSVHVIDAAQGSLRTMLDVVTPGYKRLSNEGRIVNSPMHSVSQHWDISGNGPRFKSYSAPTTYYGDLVGVWSGAQLSETTLGGRHIFDVGPMLVEASTKALSNVKPPDYQGLVAIGELKETLKYLKNPLASGLKMAGSLEKRVEKIRRRMPRSPSHKEEYLAYVQKFRTRQGRQVVSDLTNVYLEFRYAVRPLIHDVTQFMEAVSKGASQPRRETYRGFVSDSKTESWMVTNHSISGPNIVATAQYHMQSDIFIRAGTLYEYLAEVRSTASRFGLELTQVPATLWELTPLSFVYDWFGNVGDFVNALTPVAGAKRLAGWRVITHETRIERACSDYKFLSAGWSTERPGSTFEALTIVNKRRMPGLSNPGLVLKTNALDDLLSDKLKLLDLLAITKQRISRSIY